MATRPPVAMGVAHPEMTNGARVTFSPDGTKVLATYQDDGTTWLLDVDVRRIGAEGLAHRGAELRHVAAPGTLGGQAAGYWSAFASAASMAAARSAAATPRGSLPLGQYSSLWTCSSG